MGYSRFLSPRPEVLSEDGIEGIIDLKNLEDRRRRKLESRPDAFLDLKQPRFADACKKILKFIEVTPMFG